jgi:hypothetical protein
MHLAGLATCLVAQGARVPSRVGTSTWGGLQSQTSLRAWRLPCLDCHRCAIALICSPVCACLLFTILAVLCCSLSVPVRIDKMPSYRCDQQGRFDCAMQHMHGLLGAHIISQITSHQQASAGALQHRRAGQPSRVPKLI